MLWTYSYYMGARRRRLILFRRPFLTAGEWFWQPFLTVGEQFFNNTSSCIIKLITLLIYQIILNPAQAPLANPCRWPPRRQIGAIHLINAVGVGSKWLTLVMCLCLWGGGVCWCLTEFPYYSYRTIKPMVWECFVPFRTQIGVILFNSILSHHHLGRTKCTLAVHYICVWFLRACLWQMLYSNLVAITGRKRKKCKNHRITRRIMPSNAISP
jgi:hypothetical protein